jgi:hypothetical protein
VGKSGRSEPARQVAVGLRLKLACFQLNFSLECYEKRKISTNIDPQYAVAVCGIL